MELTFVCVEICFDSCFNMCIIHLLLYGTTRNRGFDSDRGGSKGGHSDFMGGHTPACLPPPSVPLLNIFFIDI